MTDVVVYEQHSARDTLDEIAEIIEKQRTDVRYLTELEALQRIFILVQPFKTLPWYYGKPSS